MSDALRARVRELLVAHTTASLATIGSDGVWAASVFYASDDDLRLIFVTDPSTRHGRNLAAGGTVAATINADVSDWREIRGLQLEGTAAVVPSAERDEAWRAYLSKFGAVQRMLESPADDDERRIGLKLRTIPLWRIEPKRMRLLDNRVRFGWKEELVF